MFFMNQMEHIWFQWAKVSQSNQPKALKWYQLLQRLALSIMGNKTKGFHTGHVKEADSSVELRVVHDTT